MSMTIQEPWTKQSSKLGGQRPRQQNYKETKMGLEIESDAESHENSTDDDDDDDDDFNTLDPEKKRLTDITDSHRKIIELCKKTKDGGREKTRPNFRGSQPPEHFIAQYKDVFDASGDDRKTLLHHLSKRMTKSLRYLVRWLLKSYPDLILQMDSEDHTALHTAIASQNVGFFEEVCEHSQNKVEALQQTGVGGTCLHKALELVSSTPNIMGVVNHIVQVLENDENAQRRDDDRVSSPLRNVLCKRDKEGNTPLHIALTTLASCSNGGDRLHSDLDSLVNLAITITQKHPEIMYERNKKSKSPYDCLGPARETEAYANLLEEMKKGIMRKSSGDEVINLLYADSGSELTIFFDIVQFSGRTIPITELDGWATHLQFESVLQHVDLPNLTISGGDDLLNTTSSDSELSSNIYALETRLDYVKLFNWLRKKGGVRRVLEANIEDDMTKPHCDEAIEMALQGLDVEILNWKKLDLCSDVIWNAARDVKELFLYSSANNDVLRSWSAEDGLGRLPKLEKLHLSILESHTTGKRIAAFREEFRTRLKKVRPGIILYEEKALWNKPVNESSSHGDYDTVSRHPWLECMYNFAMIVRNNHRHFKQYAPEVKIAIIDDGIDDRVPIFKERIAGGKSFLKRPDRQDRTIDYWIRPGGHGTQMAKLICHIFPYAKLYIIRLDEGVGDNGERQIRIDSAIKAVEWATRNSVHIISMSWSIHGPDVDGTRTKPDEFEKSVEKAYQKGITMFCTASDHGRNAESAAAKDLPAAFPYPIKIGAARADGNASAQVGYESVDFYLPGHKINLDDDQLAKGQAQSGSSLATAVAAGLAALLQYCNSIANHQKKTEMKASHALGTSQTKQAFKNLCALTSKFPEVKKLFGDTKNLDRRNEVMEKYQKIARDLEMS